MERQRLPVIASLMAIGSGIVWSFGAVLKRQSEHVDAFQYLIWRSIGIIVVIEILSAFKGQPFPTVRAWRSGRWMILANLGLFLASLAFVYAVDTTTAANAAFLGSLTPLVAVVFTRFLGEKLSRSTIIAIAVGIVGLVLTVFGDLAAGNMLGNASALLASVGFAIYTISLRSSPTRDWSPVLPGYGALMILVCGIVTVARDRPLIPAGPDIARGLFHGAVIIVVGTLMFNTAIKHVPAVPMTVFAQAEMVFVPIWCFLILDETPTPLAMLGGAIIFSAVVGKALYDTRGDHPPELITAPDVPLL
ncbi:MAG TPA: DMT family transporter [Ilumatobacteraceae bacterium]|nr:DMT family transporter [Ilumatobacteraceae bacterium]HRB05251.1 DMT family transporter [Ilumatobacteraceae bacterium]